MNALEADGPADAEGIVVPFGLSTAGVPVGTLPAASHSSRHIVASPLTHQLLPDG